MLEISALDSAGVVLSEVRAVPTDSPPPARRASTTTDPATRPAFLRPDSPDSDATAVGVGAGRGVGRGIGAATAVAAGAAANAAASSAAVASAMSLPRIAAPIATVSSGRGPATTGTRSSVETSSATSGMAELPPVSTT
ncbi:unannotated protein [freshwater metagenome]|uniref:Unannotated protein n=1 Tax=freshwater metagenome TaxID=449393 RepID=A0A6J7H4K1_9ZZZZ